VTPKGAAQPNRPETAPPSDGGAVSAGAAADQPATAGTDAAAPGGAAPTPESPTASNDAADTAATPDDEASSGKKPGDSTIDLKVAAAGSPGGEGGGAPDASKPDASKPDASTPETSTVGDTGTAGAEAGAETIDGKESDVQNVKTVEDTRPAGGDQVDDGQPIDRELETLRGNLGELTRDLQRITAEYANYRKRVDRDRALTAEQATATVLTQLLPVLDDLDRARDHGDLVGPFGSVADQLITVLSKFGLTAFGNEGDRFDPTRHEAVSHASSPDVTETTCVQIMRRGYQLGERLLRPALVGVADPE
jgi:molecular chaperone GrpE